MLDLATRISDVMKDAPATALEEIADKAGCSVAEVVRHLPAGEATCLPGRHFVEVMQDIRNWGEITFIVNTGDVILEAKAPLGDGSLGHGFYNLHGKPISGHLRADACEMIAFVSRSFMGRATHSVQFYNQTGGCMFKIYLGRDDKKNFLTGQEQAFANLRHRLQAG